ncbi:uncharacterized protein N7518_001359 [Penicillium psychrosexuale]|uniref:uncharacterized protein n=1 Tax=Penicillium psychrosexuale TaxID=1002107 RepID=UPI002545041C|nr:uncharacterized protein N7518_001359 [Penicillium psychrosexuale]KAJ5799291.1 hypothetical protein N7518_001359 [Penicillium psychrosexuale]
MSVSRKANRTPPARIRPTPSPRKEHHKNAIQPPKSPLPPNPQTLAPFTPQPLVAHPSSWKRSGHGNPR